MIERARTPPRVRRHSRQHRRVSVVSSNRLSTLGRQKSTNDSPPSSKHNSLTRGSTSRERPRSTYYHDSSSIRQSRIHLHEPQQKKRVQPRSVSGMASTDFMRVLDYEFDLLDRDHDGWFSQDELGEVLLTEGLPQDLSRNFYLFANKPYGSRISRQEYANLVENKELMKARYENIQRLYTRLSALNTGGDGGINDQANSQSIDFDTFKTFHEQNFPEAKAKQVKQTFDKYDTDQDGYLQLDDFHAFLSDKTQPQAQKEPQQPRQKEPLKSTGWTSKTRAFFEARKKRSR